MTASRDILNYERLITLLFATRIPLSSFKAAANKNICDPFVLEKGKYTGNKKNSSTFL